MRIAVLSSGMLRWPPTASPTWESLQDLKLLEFDLEIIPNERCNYSSRGRWDHTNPRTKRAAPHHTYGPSQPQLFNYSDRLLPTPQILGRERIPDPFDSDPVFELYYYSSLTRRNL